MSALRREDNSFLISQYEDFCEVRCPGGVVCPLLPWKHSSGRAFLTRRHDRQLIATPPASAPHVSPPSLPLPLQQHVVGLPNSRQHPRGRYCAIVQYVVGWCWLWEWDSACLAVTPRVGLTPSSSRLLLLQASRQNGLPIVLADV